MKICSSTDLNQTRRLEDGQNILGLYGILNAGHRETPALVIVTHVKILLACAHHDADLGRNFHAFNVLNLLLHLAYVFCKQGCTAAVDDNQIIRALVQLNSFVNEITRYAAIIGRIAFNAKDIKLLND